MKPASAATGTRREVEATRSPMLPRIVFGFAALALLSFGISVAGRMAGHSIAMAGHTDDLSIHEIAIGNDVIAAPANAIRFAAARRDGAASRLDLYLHWPDLEGYSQSRRNDFNHAGGSRSIVFLSFENRAMSRDMSGRFLPVFPRDHPPWRSRPAGTMLFGFEETSGYANEILAIGGRPEGEPFVARA